MTISATMTVERGENEVPLTITGIFNRRRGRRSAEPDEVDEISDIEARNERGMEMILSEREEDKAEELLTQAVGEAAGDAAEARADARRDEE